ncbi:conjugal transfer protein D [gut metagenome]|uniref:Conjugal transfer protein D n=1 Tax=gut metagenome TaxID=749906 RepID=J9CN02_9ZZZZ
MKLKLSKKTYYTMGLLGTALSLVQAIAAFAGGSMRLLDSAVFCLTGLMLLFLASVHGTPAADKRSLFCCFLLLVGSMFFSIPLLQIILVSLVYPAFAAYEKNRDERLTNQFRAVCIGDLLWMGFRIVVLLGEVKSMMLPANLAGLLAICARLWLMFSLYKRERDER